VDLEPPLPGWLAHDVDHHAQGPGGPVDQPAGEALVSKHKPDRREQINAQQRRFSAVTVLPQDGQTATVISRPAVSVTMNHLPPLIFLPAS
jgi:hypothetical protein